MYTLIIPKSVKIRIGQFGLKSPSVFNKIKKLESDPHSIAKNIILPSIGPFYTNAGKYVLIFTIDDNDHSVLIHSIYYRSAFYRLMARSDAEADKSN